MQWRHTVTEGAHAYCHELFNILDVCLLLLLFTIQGCHLAALQDDGHVDGTDTWSVRTQVAVPLQSLAVLGAWLRLLQCLCESRHSHL